MTHSRARTMMIAMFVFFASPGAVARAQSCDLALAALAAVQADSSNAVIVDRTVIGVPQFALNGYITIRRGDTAFARVAEPQVRSVNRERVPVMPCLAEEHHWRTIADSILIPIFKAADGWQTFQDRHAPAFVMISQPMVVGDTATMIVAIARGKLSGRGVIIQLVRDATGHWIKRTEAQLWIS